MNLLRAALLTIVSCLSCSLANAAPPASRMVTFEIAAQPLSDALNEFAKQSGLQIVFHSQIGKGLIAPSLSGQFTPDAALHRLLSNTELQYSYLKEDAVAIQAKSAGPASASVASEEGSASSQATGEDLRMARAEMPTIEGEVQQPRKEEKVASRQPEQTAQELVVTGTYIRGATSSASPLSVYSREQIDRSGAGSVQRFIQTLPENFKGGASEGTVGTLSGGSSVNAVEATSPNLRGLGNDSTLVLLNGRRLAAGNRDGNFIDVSVLPVAALERVEVMPDGASALYGSDAVGGVINFIMRKDFTGAETRMRYGAVSEGDLQELQVAQTLGTNWNSGSALLSYEYFEQQPLDLADKTWAGGTLGGPFDVLPGQRRHSLFTSVEQTMTEKLQIFMDATYAQREVLHSRIWTPTVESDGKVKIDAFSVTAGARTQLASDYELELDLSRGESATNANTLNLRSGGSYSRYQADSSVSTLDAKLTGSLFALPAGRVLFAAGAQYRQEDYRNFNILTHALTFDDDRRIWAGFAEARVPVMGPGASTSGKPRVELTLAGRYEDYDDFGSTANPKVGLVWQPLTQLKLRGTWGTSFKAPVLNDLNPVHSQTAVLNVFDPQAVPPRNMPVAIVFGGNPRLGPENATTATLGLDWAPVSVPGLRTHLTYYDIAYKDRITNPQQAFRGILPNTTADALRYPEITAQFIQRNPTVAQLQTLAANSMRFDDFTAIPGGVNLASIVALVDYRMVNLARVDTSGIDVDLAYGRDVGAASLDVGVNATYMLQLDNKLAPTAPAIEAVDTTFNPSDLKLRTHTTVQKGGLSAALFVNYVDAYTDTRGGTSVPVSSWMTVDLNLGYRFDDVGGLWNGMSVSVGANNLTDRAPPHIAPVATAYSLVVFDGANADVRGRFVYAQLMKRW